MKNPAELSVLLLLKLHVVFSAYTLVSKGRCDGSNSVISTLAECSTAASKLRGSTLTANAISTSGIGEISGCYYKAEYMSGAPELIFNSGSGSGTCAPTSGPPNSGPWGTTCYCKTSSSSTPNTNCVGAWSACGSNCKKSYSVTTSSSGTGTSCPAGR